MASVVEVESDPTALPTRGPSEAPSLLGFVVRRLDLRAKSELRVEPKPHGVGTDDLEYLGIDEAHKGFFLGLQLEAQVPLSTRRKGEFGFPRDSCEADSVFANAKRARAESIAPIDTVHLSERDTLSAGRQSELRSQVMVGPLVEFEGRGLRVEFARDEHSPGDRCSCLEVGGNVERDFVCSSLDVDSLLCDSSSRVGSSPEDVGLRGKST